LVLPEIHPKKRDVRRGGPPAAALGEGQDREWRCRLAAQPIRAEGGEGQWPAAGGVEGRGTVEGGRA